MQSQDTRPAPRNGVWEGCGAARDGVQRILAARQTCVVVLHGEATGYMFAAWRLCLVKAVRYAAHDAKRRGLPI